MGSGERGTNDKFRPAFQGAYRAVLDLDRQTLAYAGRRL
ncbi:hypothetical protein NB231_00180 [Nitrococcus mobilis Nb-231]|uniref:Uncharacterized protein n=1 Tax=Nitrococcus mobilis Nb-231 TaxID=314278 RepID=A4BTJ9_9GAMM|nr:hypothetical protein NB231_00180 [Nitrococcus mobilis Nb-231]